MTEGVSHLRFSILGGMVASVWINLNSDDLIKTIIMATLGTVVSYIVLLLVKCIHKWIKHPKTKD